MMRCNRVRFAVALGLGMGILTAGAQRAGATANAEVSIDFDGVLAVPEATDAEAGATIAQAIVSTSTPFVEETRSGNARGDADSQAMELGCVCGSSEAPQSRCETLVARDDLLVTGGPAASVVITIAMRVVGSFSASNYESEPDPGMTLYFRIDAIGPGSRVEYVVPVGGEPLVTQDIGSNDFIETTATGFEAIVRRSRSVPVGTPFALEALLRTTCQVGLGALADPSDGMVNIEATAGDFSVTVPDGYTFVPEPRAALLGITSVAALASRARRSRGRATAAS